MNLVAVARHQPAAHELRFDHHAVDRAVGHLWTRGIDERRDARERATARERHRPIALASRAVTDEAISLKDPLPPVQRLGGARARVRQPVGRLARERELATRYRNSARDGRD